MKNQRLLKTYHELLEKLNYIAGKTSNPTDKKSINDLIEILIQNNLKEFESETNDINEQ